MHFYWNCTMLDKIYCIIKSTETCVECIHQEKSCNLTSLNLIKWYHFKIEHFHVKQEWWCVCAVKQHFLKQLKSLKNQQECFFINEIKNLNISEKFKVNVDSKQITLSTLLNMWGFTLLISVNLYDSSTECNEISETVFYNFIDSWLILRSSLYISNSFIWLNIADLIYSVFSQFQILSLFIVDNEMFFV